ncbi:MAG: AMP-binding protein [Acetobacteraceae bacterium]
MPLDHVHLERSLIESLALVVQRQPDRIAIAEAGRTLSYRQLWRLVAGLAGAVAASHAPPGPVALLLRDGAMCAAALFAGIITGRPCLALDRGHPPGRNAALMQAAGAALVVVQRGDEAAHAAAHDCRLLAVDDAIPAADAVPSSLSSGLPLDAPAFILPTSGSTGQPKLVVHSQRTAAYRANQRGDTARLTLDDRVMYCGGPPTSYSGMMHLLAQLRAGAGAHLIDVKQEGIRGLLHRLADERITVLLAGTSLLRGVLSLPDAQRAVSHLRLVRTGGEATLWSDVALLRSVLPPGCALETGYGATEATNLRWPIGSEAHGDAIRVPAGWPEAGGACLVVDDEGKPCPPGVPGELVVRSRYNALGEWRDGRCEPGRLIPDPADPGQRIYFTGDLARQASDGAYVVLGRKDRQLNINGQRVEPMEIEAVIREAPGVQDAVVLARTVDKATILMAFVTARPGIGAGVADTVRQALQHRLPGHMVPARIDVMCELPRLPGGKVDMVTLLARATA